MPPPHVPHLDEPISSTDLLLFRQFANPEKTDIPDNVPDLMRLKRTSSNSPANNHHVRSGSNRRYQQQHHPPSYSNMTRTPPNQFDQQYLNNSPSPSPSSTYLHPSSASHYDTFVPNNHQQQDLFDSYVQNEMNRISEPRSNYHHYSDRDRDREHETFHAGDYNRFEQNATLSNFMDGHNDIGIQSSTPPNDELNDPYYQRYMEPNNDGATLQRQMLLHKLKEHQDKGVFISVPLVESTPLSLLKTELDLIEEKENRAATVQEWKVFLELGTRGLEVGNIKLLNNFLPISGWTDGTLGKNPTMYDRTLGRIYDVYARHSQGNPIWELVLAMAVSLGAFVLQKYMFAGQLFGVGKSMMPNMTMPAAAPSAPPPPNAPAPPTFEPPMHKDANAGTGGARPRRIIRPPVV